MKYIYACHNNKMAIRAATPAISFEDGKIFDDITLALRPFNKNIEHTTYVPPINGFQIKGTTCYGAFQKQGVKTIDMIVITLEESQDNKDRSASSEKKSNDSLSRESLVKLVKSLGYELTEGKAKEFEGYIFDDLRYGEVYPDEVALGGQPVPTEKAAKPFLIQYNPLLGTHKPSVDSVKPLKSQKQTIFAGFR